MGIKTVWIQNQCSCSPATPGKSWGDADPQPVHCHSSGVGTPVAIRGWPWYHLWQGSAGSGGWRRGLSSSPATLSPQLAGDPVLDRPCQSSPPGFLTPGKSQQVPLVGGVWLPEVQRMQGPMLLPVPQVPGRVSPLQLLPRASFPAAWPSLAC